MESLLRLGFLNQRFGLTTLNSFGQILLPQQRHIPLRIGYARRQRDFPAVGRASFFQPGQPVRKLPASDACLYQPAPATPSTNSFSHRMLQLAQIALGGLGLQAALLFFDLSNSEQPAQAM